jgi:hypothetical protein
MGMRKARKIFPRAQVRKGWVERGEEGGRTGEKLESSGGKLIPSLLLTFADGSVSLRK